MAETKRHGSARVSSGAYGLVVFPPCPPSLVPPPPATRAPSRGGPSRPLPIAGASAYPVVVSIAPPSPPLLTSEKDPYYGHEDTVKLCARFVTHLCHAYPDLPPLSTTVPPRLVAAPRQLHRVRPPSYTALLLSTRCSFRARLRLRPATHRFLAGLPRLLVPCDGLAL